MIRQLKLFLFLIPALLIPVGCHEIDSHDNDPRGNFNALCDIIDEHYCFFREKNIDWDQVRSRYGAMISPKMSSRELFQVCSDMLDELRDGHTNLSTPFATSYYRAWWSDYPQNFSLRLIQQSYFDFSYSQSSGLMYGMLDGNVGYIYYGSFSNPVGEGNLDAVLQELDTATGLIFDVRDNGGGELTNVERIVARFIAEPRCVGYIMHKTGPGHDDFSEPYPITYKPAPAGRVRWGKPVVVLTNRSTFSAANNFASVMRCLPGVTLVGATTGGGSGMPYSSELPCGWSVRFSACSMLDVEGRSTESGIEPHVAVDLDPADALQGHDTILDRAIQIIKNG